MVATGKTTVISGDFCNNGKTHIKKDFFKLEIQTRKDSNSYVLSIYNKYILLLYYKIINEVKNLQ